MNTTTYSGRLYRSVYRLLLAASRLGARVPCKTFSTLDQQLRVIQQIYVINLDRQVGRWNQIQREIQQICDVSGTSLTTIAKRFSAVDARYYTECPRDAELQTCYSLEDQLFVEPNTLLASDQVARYRTVLMTRQEIAVALSHIALWKHIASGEHRYALVLEDDVYFRRNFARILDKAWPELARSLGTSDGFDVLYLSYKEAKKVEKREVSNLLFKPLRGLWQLSGYVLSKNGAKRLLSLLPVRGPVDLWINRQFERIDVFATRRSLPKDWIICLTIYTRFYLSSRRLVC